MGQQTIFWELSAHHLHIFWVSEAKFSHRKGLFDTSSFINVKEKVEDSIKGQFKTLKKIKQIKNIEPEMDKEFLNVITLHAIMGRLDNPCMVHMCVC